MGWRSSEGGSWICSGGTSSSGVAWGADTCSRTSSLAGSCFVLNSGSVLDNGSILIGGSAVKRNRVMRSGSVLNNVVFAGENFSPSDLFLH